ncbi:MAG: hypothetical protein ABID64_00850 [Nitrospirota bacterium]
MNNILESRYPEEKRSKPRSPQNTISTNQPRDPHEPILTAAGITQSIRVIMQYEEIIRTLESAGFTITQKTGEICYLISQKGAINVYCVQDEITHMVHKVEIELAIEEESQQKPFSAEITKLFEKNKLFFEEL